MTKKIIYLYGGPGTGKSTTAAAVFAAAKRLDVNAELVREYVKNWVWEGRQIMMGDQVYLTAKQCRAEQILFNDVNVIISDSPVWLSKFYEQKYDPTTNISQYIIEKHVEIAHLNEFEFVHIFLERHKKYNPQGRLQNESEAKQFDTEIRTMLDNLGIRYHVVPATIGSEQEILKIANIGE
jgi:nicotinamide riboside kinase